MNAFLVVVDISGYTRFMKYHAMSLLHAEEIITELLESVIVNTAPPLILNKLEGDAVFLYAEEGLDPCATGREIIRQLSRCFEGFTARAQALLFAGVGGCPCDACTKIGRLSLKAVVHHGHVVLKRIRQFEELASEGVIVAHRLLKSSIAAKQYLLLTEPCYRFTGGLPGHIAEDRFEEAEGIGSVKVRVYYPHGELPVTAPYAPRVRLAGVLEAGRKWLKLFWCRLTRPRPRFYNLPDNGRLREGG